MEGNSSDGGMSKEWTNFNYNKINVQLQSFQKTLKIFTVL